MEFIVALLKVKVYGLNIQIMMVLELLLELLVQLGVVVIVKGKEQYRFMNIQVIVGVD